MMTGTSGCISLTLGSISRPVIPGMLMSDRINISDCSMVLAMRASASAAEIAKSITKRCARKSRRNCWRNSASTSARHRPREPGRSRLTSLLVVQTARSWQNDGEFGELPGLGLDIDRATMLFHDDVVAHRKAKTGAFAGRLGRKERIEHLFLHLGRDADTVITNADFHRIPEISCGCTEARFIT